MAVSRARGSGSANRFRPPKGGKTVIARSKMKTAPKGRVGTKLVARQTSRNRQRAATNTASRRRTSASRRPSSQAAASVGTNAHRQSAQSIINMRPKGPGLVTHAARGVQRVFNSSGGTQRPASQPRLGISPATRKGSGGAAIGDAFRSFFTIGDFLKNR